MYFFILIFQYCFFCYFQVVRDDIPCDCSLFLIVCILNIEKNNLVGGAIHAKVPFSIKKPSSLFLGLEKYYVSHQ